MFRLKSLLPIILCSILFINNSYAQDGMGIGTLTPDASAVLEIHATDKGLLIPRLTSTGINAIPAPANGLIVYDKEQKNLKINTSTDGSKQWVDLHPMPKGGIIMWSGNPAALPTGWKLCDGKSYNSLGAVVTSGTAGSILTPDLSGRFIASYKAGDTNYAINDTGGQNSVLLTPGETALVGHGHGVTDGGHTHSASSGNTAQNLVIQTRATKTDNNGGGRFSMGTPDAEADRTISIPAHNHTVTVNSSATGVSVNNASAANASAAHENRPLFYVLAFIMKI